MRDLATTLGWLVDIPSETGHEARICDEIETRLSGLLPLRRVEDSLVAGEPGSRPLVLLVGHLDTVPSQGQGPARVEGGVLHGLGSADMKGGLAVMIHLLESDECSNGPYDVAAVFYGGEEGPASANTLEGVLREVGWLTDATFAVVLEPSDGEVQVGCNGSMNARVVFTGRSAHSARPWWGENAVTKAGDWLSSMHALPPETHTVDGLEYREVFSVTMASGGVARNVIPPRFEVNLNYRFNPSRSVDEAAEVLRGVCDEADEVEIVDAAPAGPVRADHPFVGELVAASGAAMAAKQGWTDVARLGMHGVPAVNFGPGRAAQAHQEDEWVALAELDATYDALALVLSGGARSMVDS